jgi:uncharacterized protein (TIGR01732 family)
MSCGCGGYPVGGYTGGYDQGPVAPYYGGHGFTLIVVLFILLIIIGCGCFLGYGYK